MQCIPEMKIISCIGLSQIAKHEDNYKLKLSPPNNQINWPIQAIQTHFDWRTKMRGRKENGPTNPANYSDHTLKNKDFYYYQGKCYGNCKNKYL